MGSAALNTQQQQQPPQSHHDWPSMHTAAVLRANSPLMALPPNASAAAAVAAAAAAAVAAGGSGSAGGPSILQPPTPSESALVHSRGAGGTLPTTVAPQSGHPTWNHIQMSPFFTNRQPQHAHMSSSEHHLLVRPPTWHTPTSNDTVAPPPPLFSLQQMLSSDPATAAAAAASLAFINAARTPPAAMATAADLSLAPRSTQSPRNNCVTTTNTNSTNTNSSSNSNHNGESSSSHSPISLSIRDAKQINSLAVERRQTFQELINPKRPKRVDSILERLNTAGSSVIVSAAQSSHSADENSNSSQPGGLPAAPTVSIHHPASPLANMTRNNTVNVPSVTEEEVLSPASNEDSLDSAKSRRKRKPSKTIRMSKDDKQPAAIIPLSPDKVEEAPVPNLLNLTKTNENTISTITTTTSAEMKLNCVTVSENISTNESSVIIKAREELVEVEKDSLNTSRRRTLSETETIENIAAMIASTDTSTAIMDNEERLKPVSASPDTKENLENVLSSPPTAETATESDVVVEKSSNFVEVENQLEKMFAGLDDNASGIANAISNHDPLVQLEPRERVTSTSSDVDENTLQKVRSKTKTRIPCGRTKKAAESRRTSETNSNESGGRVKTLIKSNKIVQKMSRKEFNDSIRPRGPFVQIRGPRDSPVSVNIVNTPLSGDPNDNITGSGVCGDFKPSKMKSFHDDSEYRNRVRSKGLHSSTLSIKYDAHTTDTSWICVFCKRGPHTTDLNSSINNSPLNGYSSGDLFGPYIITSDCPEYQESIDQLNELNLNVQINQNDSSIGGRFAQKKAKRRHLQQHIEIDQTAVIPPASGATICLEGMIEQPATDSTSAAATTNRYEIWAHEDCIVWSPGVYLAGARIVGLDGAVWTCSNCVCCLCDKRGASIQCLMRNCRLLAHVCCAKVAGWCLNEDTYKAYCQRHQLST